MRMVADEGLRTRRWDGCTAKEYLCVADRLEVIRRSVARTSILLGSRGVKVCFLLRSYQL